MDLDERQHIEHVLMEFYEFNKGRGFPENPQGKTYVAHMIADYYQRMGN